MVLEGVMERRSTPPAATRVSSFAFVPLDDLETRAYRVLLVDDDPDSLTLMERTLLKASEFHPEVALAHDAKQALQILTERSFDMVIADQMMPEMNGIELLIEVREHYPDTLRTLITAYPSLGTVLRAVNLAQVHSYIEKPFDPRHLNRAVYEALLRRQEREHTMVVNARDVEEALSIIHGLERELPGKQDGSGVTFVFASPVDFNQFIFEMLQAKRSGIKDVHVFESRFHVTISIAPAIAAA